MPLDGWIGVGHERVASGRGVGRSRGGRGRTLARPKPKTSGGYAELTCWLSVWEFHCVSTKTRRTLELMQFAVGSR